jgi:hypothetical protein
MNKFKLALLGLTLASSASFAGECAIPDIPELPDGAAASMEQMLAGQSAVKAFQAANLEYMSCLDPMVTAAGEAAKAKDASDESKAASKQLEEQYNTAVSMEESVAGQFNTALKAYKAANPS